MQIGERRSIYVGECIYCGSKENLTDEHAIPLALQGNRVLKDGSCLSCNAITTRFERFVARDSMKGIRAVLGMPSRRKQNRPTSLPLIIVRGEERHEIQVPLEDSVPTLILPELGPPEIYPEIGHALGLRAGAFEAKLHFPVDRIADKHVRALIEKYRADAVETPYELHHQSFLRLVAKIGICEAIGVYGLKQFERLFVRDAVLGKDRPEYWVGSDGRYCLHLQGGFDDSSHVIAAVRSPGQQEVWIRVKLWNKSITPEYIVVCGRLRKNYARFLDGHGLIA